MKRIIAISLLLFLLGEILPTAILISNEFFSKHIEEEWVDLNAWSEMEGEEKSENSEVDEIALDDYFSSLYSLSLLHGSVKYVPCDLEYLKIKDVKLDILFPPPERIG